MPLCAYIRLMSSCAVMFGVLGAVACAQTDPGTPPAAPAPSVPWEDPLGRSTPRGTVIGFFDAARAGDYVLAARYVDARGARAEALARELFIVLDARLPARLTRISDEPDGPAKGLTLSREIVGTIEGPKGSVSIVVERLSRGDPGPIWLFSAGTLEAIPAVHDEIVKNRKNAILPEFLVSSRFAGIRLMDWLAVLLGLPLLYVAMIPLNRVLTPLIGRLWRRVFREPDTIRRNVLPVPARILIVLLAASWLVSTLPLSLVVRQLWSSAAGLTAVATVAWLLILLNGEIERHLQRGISPSNAAAASLLRLVRRSADVLVLVGALFVILSQLGIDPTPAIAGLGVGGIAVALAAQKTLENVIAGASLLFDRAVCVGDVLKMGDVLGTVDHIGLRSTRIRTMDRTIVSVPNGQIANVSLETLSSRDKFWFHPVVGLRYETTPAQLRAVVDGLRRLLDRCPLVDPSSVRVRFVRLGSFSLDIDVCAYLRARDLNHFLEIQEELLFEVTEVVSRAGTAIAFPSQTMYVANVPPAMPGREGAVDEAVRLQESTAAAFHRSGVAGSGVR